MDSAMRWLLVFVMAGKIVSAAASNGAPLLSPVPSFPTWATDQEMELAITSPDDGLVYMRINVLPLTMEVGFNQSETARSAVYIYGDFDAADASNYANITSSNAIPFLSCDNTNASFISQSQIFESLISDNHKAIILYSTQAPLCTVDADIGYPVFTTTSMADAQTALNLTSAAGSLSATIIGSNTTGGGSTDTQESMAGSSSAVAMSILYSITGLITLLFLVIIATGAVRAHRYPERYGPRSGSGGRPRQSRAKGLARAVLETLPIVKFGDAAPAKSDPALELESGIPRKRGDSEDEPAATPAIPAKRREAPVQSLAAASGDVQQLDAAGAMKAAAPAEAKQELAGKEPAEVDDSSNTGCSICTEDFTVGEDVRVLPCNHKFHPPCIDPWLVNVSGTCPLCRYDLRPRQSENAETDGEERASQDTDGQPLPPPLDVEQNEHTGEDSAEPAQRRRTSRFLDSRLGELHRLRHASVEERIATLRRYRTQQQQQQQQSSEVGPSSAAAGATEAGSAGHEAESDEPSRRARLTARLRDKFRIRTRTQPPGSTEAAVATETPSS